jgi:hypothetical protein
MILTDQMGGGVDFLNQLLRGISFVPALVSGIETIFASRSGAEKKDAAMSFLESALGAADAIARRDVVDPEKFRQGMGLVLDGVVECLNASAWAKKNGTVAIEESPAVAGR